MTTRGSRAAVVVAMLALAGTAASCSSGGQEADETPTIKSSPTLGRTHGPNGEQATPARALRLSPREVAKLRAGHHGAALVWHEDSDFTEAVTAGVLDEFRPLGIRVVAETSAGFDPARQKADIENVAAKKPAVMLTLPVDPVITASAYRQVARQGTKIVLLSNLPQGMRHGRDYVNVVTDDLFDMGKRAADALAAAVGGKGEVGYFFLDANSFVANQRDQAFLKTITANYPQIDVVARPESAIRTRPRSRPTALWSGTQISPGCTSPSRSPPETACLPRCGGTATPLRGSSASTSTSRWRSTWPRAETRSQVRQTESVAWAVSAGLGVGLGVGAVNGLFVALLRLPSFLVTLASLGIVAGLAHTITDLQSVAVANDDFINVFGSGDVGSIPGLAFWGLGAVALGQFAFRHTRFGAHVVATGDNASAARVAGIRVDRVRFAVLVLSGGSAAVAGILYTGRLQGATYTLGEQDLLVVVAAVVIGGTRLFGGKGSVIGALLGSLILGTLTNGLILWGFSSSEQMIAQGVLLLIAISLTLREPRGEQVS